MAGESRSGLGRGGMHTKVRAARLASRSGAATIIAAGNTDNVITTAIAGNDIGTFFRPNVEQLVARKRWLAGQLQVKGKLVLDSGAVKVLKSDGKSLLAVGVKSVYGHFQRGELVTCVDQSGNEIARGLINYSNAETQKIAGKSSLEFEKILGYTDDPELIHRDNMVLL
jgi:glutamate 5-kinase